MAVKLRLRRIGKKKQPFYRIVAIDSRAPRDGSYLDKIGHYNPITHPAEVLIDRAKAFQWLNNGAIPSDTVMSLFRHEGILHEWDLRKRGMNDEQVAAELAKWQELQEQRAKRREAKEAMKKRESEKKKESEKPEEAPAAKAAQPAAAAPVAAVAETPAEPVAETVVEPVAETAAEPVVETPAEPVVETAAEPVVETAAEPAAEEKPAEPAPEA